MSLRDVLLAVHVAVGAAALVLGAGAFLTGQGARDLVGRAYQGAVVAVAATALGLSLLNFDDFGWLIILALATATAALAGPRVAPERGRGARALRAHLIGGSYVALVTAVLVVSWDSPLSWVLPAAVGVPLIVAYHS